MTSLRLDELIAIDVHTHAEVSCRNRKIGLVMFTVDSEHQIGARRIPNEEVADAARDNADIMIAFAGTLDEGLRGGGFQAGGAAADPQGQCDRGAALAVTGTASAGNRAYGGALPV